MLIEPIQSKGGRDGHQGYQYQYTYSLYQILDKAWSGSGCGFYLERLDDLEQIEEEGHFIVQIKGKKGNLLDTCPDFWKTLHHWYSLYLSDSIDIDNYEFCYVTTEEIKLAKGVKSLVEGSHNEILAYDALFEAANKSTQLDDENCFILRAEKASVINFFKKVRISPEGLSLEKLKTNVTPQPSDSNI